MENLICPNKYRQSLEHIKILQHALKRNEIKGDSFKVLSTIVLTPLIENSVSIASGEGGSLSKGQFELRHKVAKDLGLLSVSDIERTISLSQLI